MTEKTDEKSSDTIQYTLRIPKTIKLALENIAKESDRSLSRQVISVLRKFCDDQAKEKAQK